MLADPARASTRSLLSTTHPTAAVDPLELFAQSTAHDRALWLRPSSDEAMVGLGVAYDIKIDGAGDRFAAATRAWQALLEEATGGITLAIDSALAGANEADRVLARAKALVR